MFKIILMVLVFEISVVSVHFYVFSEVLMKLTELSETVIQLFSLIWSLSVSVIPATYYLYIFVFGRTMEKIKAWKDKTKAETGTVSFVTFIFTAVVLVMFVAEIKFFHDLLNDGGDLFSVNSTLDIEGIFSGLALTIAHHAMTAILMWIVYMKFGDKLVGSLVQHILKQEHVMNTEPGEVEEAIQDGDNEGNKINNKVLIEKNNPTLQNDISKIIENNKKIY